MKLADIRKKTTDDMHKLLKEMEEELHEFRFGMSGGRVKNVRRARVLRHDIARIKTILGERARSA
ncbi:MAG: 50S ribosomal protein L29 [Patescibacteria group bacterium]|nr:50S ribosomal protein L29 [Patescibacteria group bacterium]